MIAMACDYVVTAERLTDPDIGNCDVFGIVCRTPGKNIVIHDISHNGRKVVDIAKKFNRLHLSPCQFRDEVEDLIAAW